MQCRSVGRESCHLFARKKEMERRGRRQDGPVEREVCEKERGIDAHDAGHEEKGRGSWCLSLIVNIPSVIQRDMVRVK